MYLCGSGDFSRRGEMIDESNFRETEMLCVKIIADRLELFVSH